jgi:uncharacterized protein YneF (UPF0154 family)
VTALCTILIGGGLVFCGFFLGAWAAIRACSKCVVDPHYNPKVVRAMIRSGVPPEVFFNQKKWWT